MLAPALIVTSNTFSGRGPFVSHQDPTLVLQTFLAVLAITALITAATISEHRQSEESLRKNREQLRESEERYRDLFENAQDFIVTVDLRGRFTSVNNAVLNASSFTREELLSRTIFDITKPASIELARAAFNAVLNGERRTGTQLEMVRKDGGCVWVEVNSRRMERQGVPVGIQSIGRDITWRKRFEEQLLHSQKMEAVGRLAGGVAHDFNNLLGVIIGYSELILEQIDGPDEVRRRLTEIKKAGARAAEVTRQLLAFSRKQMLTPKSVNLNSIVNEITRTLIRLLGEDIELITNLSPNPLGVHVDPAQMEQVIMNLSINARDAMPRGGKLILETANVRLDDVVEQEVPVTTGSYAMLAISDTGIGMNDATRTRVFEPFFTTKTGEKTGMGLATVYGFVKQSGGYIWAYSEPGRAATFKIYLPLVTIPVKEPEVEQIEPLPRGSETVLLVEDSAALREMNGELLSGLGYKVIPAAYGAEALEIAERTEGEIHLLLTDVVMPGMSGRELAERLALIRPETKVIYMSGYADSVVIQHGVLGPNTAFLQKPFGRELLATKVREVLGRTDMSRDGNA